MSRNEFYAFFRASPSKQRGFVRFATGCFAVAAIAVFSIADSTSRAATTPSWPIRLREDMAKLARVEWRLRESATPLCPTTLAGGIVVDDSRAYAEADRPMLRAVLGLGEAPQVAYVVPQSPADRAGVRAGDAILAVNGTPTERLRASAADPALFSDTVEQALAAGGPVRLGLQRGAEVLTLAYTPLALCGERFVLKTDSAVDAYRERGTARLAVTTGLIEFAASEDELALIAGHELGHVVARDGKAGSIGERRRIEDRADRTGALLAHCAGYDVRASLAFWRRFAKRDWLGFLRDPSHRSPGRRIASIEAALPGFNCPARLPGSVANP